MIDACIYMLAKHLEGGQIAHGSVRLIKDHLHALSSLLYIVTSTLCPTACVCSHRHPHGTLLYKPFPTMPCFHPSYIIYISLPIMHKIMHTFRFLLLHARELCCSYGYSSVNYSDIVTCTINNHSTL